SYVPAKKEKGLIPTPDYRIIYPLRISKSRIAGKGAFAIQTIPARRKIGDLGGVIITMREARKLIRNKQVINLVELDDDLALNASANPNDIRFINHSCNPNTYMRVLKDRVEFYALRTIRKGEELSCDYGETHHEGTLPCRCGAVNCRGYI
ncbi:MAG: hypothetical protein RL447_713, partial [Bacteroidota bacterium]